MSKKLIIALLLVTSMLLNVFSVGGVLAGTVTSEELLIYVSPDGNDSNPGTISSPLRTFAGAKYRVRSMAGERPVRVIFREGQYDITETQIFSNADSGREGAPITYEAYEGETAVISGAIKLDVSNFTQVTDREVLMKIPVDARNHVLQLDLKKHGIQRLLSTKEMVESGISASGTLSMGYLLLENSEQMIAQWPNGDGGYDYMGKVYAPGGTSSFAVDMNTSACIGYTNERSDLWKNAVGNAYFQIFPNNDYRAEILALVDVDSDEKKLYISGGSQGFVETRSKARYKILNLIEELDVATEWYIDRDKMMLYYYPPKSFNENSHLEFTKLEGDLLKFEGASHINFKGLTIGNCSQIAFNMDDGTHDITIKDCVLKNIASHAIYCPRNEENRNRFITATSALATEKGVYNLDIDKNIFTNIGGCAINMQTRNITTFPNNINITNNYITRVSTIAPSIYGITLNGHDINISNNLIHSNNTGGITLKGTEGTILYNEVYDVCRQLADCGGIYQGSQYAYVGSEVAYNLVYNVRGRFDMNYTTGYSGIYMDDCHCGTYVHNNMVLNIAKGCVLNGGKYITYDSNVINVDGVPISFHARGEDPTWEYYIATLHKMDDHFMSVKEIPYMIKNYPFFAEVADGNLRAPIHNTVIDNIGNNEFVYEDRKADIERIAELGRMENNTVTTDTDIYVDIAHADMRLKVGTEIQKKHPNALTEENFDMNSIGIDWNPLEKLDSSFSRYYPVDNAVDVDNSECTFFWSEAVTADKYRIIVAEDENFENVIIDDITYYNNYKTDVLNSEKTDYYWKVFAINERRYYEKEWQSEDGVGHFTTVLTDGNDIESLETAIADAKEKAEQIIDGENYIPGTKQRALDAIEKASKVLKEEAQTASRTKIKSIVYELNYELEKCADNLILKYMNTEEFFTSKDFYNETFSGRNLTFDVKDGVLSYITDGVEAPLNGFSSKEMTERDSIYCFKAKFEYGSGWGGIALRHQVPTVLGYDGGSYLIVVKGERLELQRSGGSGGYLAAALNDGIIEEGQWHDMAFGVVNSILGARVVFVVDGNVIFDYVDADTPIYEPGYFSVFTGTEGYNVYFSDADDVYEFTPPSNPLEVNVSEFALTKNGNGYEVNGLAGNEFVNANITLNVQNGVNTLTVYDNNTEKYSIVIDDNFVVLNRITDTQTTVLSKVDNKNLKGGAHDIRFGAFRTGNSNRVVLVSDGVTVIDFYDTNPIGIGGSMTFSSANGQGIIVSAGENIPHIVDLEAENEHSGVIDHIRTDKDVITDTYKKFSIKSDFARSKYYFKRTVAENGDKAAKVRITFDQDLGQTGEEIYKEFTIDFSKGNDGWYCVGTGTYPEVFIEITSSGSGILPVGDYAGFGTTDVASIELTSKQNYFDNLFVAKTDRDILIGEEETTKLPANIEVIKKEYMFPVETAEAMGATVEINGNSITITKDGNTAIFTAGSTEYMVNSVVYNQKNPVYTTADGTVMISIDALVKAVNKKVYKQYYGLVLIADEISNTYMLTVNEAENIIKKFY